MHSLKLLIIALCILLISDLTWFGLTKNLYIYHYKDWLALKNGQLQPLRWSAAIVYILLALSIVIFVVPIAKGSLITALVYGAIMGAIIYGIYDFTCLAIFKNWPIGMAFVDWAWGIVLLGFSSTVTIYCSSLLK